MRMSAYDRWATQGPPDELDEPELTGLALEAQALVERLWDAAVDLTEIGECRYARVIARADKRVQRRIAADAQSFWPNHYAMCDADELDYLEHEAREQGEADVLEEMLERGACLECYGTGYLLTGWQACGLSPIYSDCPECAGTGKDLRGCDECGSGHHVQQCPAIRKELFR